MADLKFALDGTGFPMVFVDAIDAYVHWLPVTKIQFEYFLCAAPDSHFDAAWYDEILFLNPRVSPNEIGSHNYWKALLTGIKPAEAQRFARWLGDNYAIPTAKEWFAAYEAVRSLSPEPSSVVDKMGELRERVRATLINLNSASISAVRDSGYERTLADQMLMRMGVMEWVECHQQQSRWGGMGQTYPRFYGSLFTPDHGLPNMPNKPEEERIYAYGFRLIRRAR